MKKSIAFVSSFAFVFAVVGASVAFAAITFSGTGITGDASFNALTGVASTTLDVGASTLSIQTTNNGPVTLGTGLLTAGGNVKIAGTLTTTGTATFASTLTQTGGLVSLASTTIAGVATTTNLSITALGGATGCLSVNSTGAVTTSTCSGGGTVTTSTAITTNNFPFWGTAGGALTGTSTLTVSGTTLTQANAFQ